MSSDAFPAAVQPFGLPDRYRIRRHIASGGMASVWCAEDLVLNRSVAVKILAERFAHDRIAAARFTREARAAARVSGHPHVVTVYDVGDLEPPAGGHASLHDGRAFIVMEFLAGGTVADAIRHDSVRRHEALRWLREAASALDHAHARGIVHRDIKPANFLLDRGASGLRSLHVADFGIARLTSEETITSSDQLFGTAAYLSPEQALGQEAGSASDRYALAVAAFELLTGERPFSAAHFSAQARQHIEEPPPAASELDRTLPAAVDDVLYAGLAKRAEDRPTSATAFVTALEDALRNRPLAHGPPRRAARARAPDPAAPAASTAAARGPETSEHRAARPSRVDAPPGGRRRIVALASLVAAILVVGGIALGASHGSGGGAPAVAARDGGQSTTTHATKAARAGHGSHVARARPVKRHVTATITPSAAELQSTGHQEMLEGDYSTAIPTLEQAVSDAPPSSTTYAYALYDLGRSEVMSGDPQAAIPVLRERLKIPNQRGTVRVMLQRAIVEAGESTTSTPTTSSSGTDTTGGAAPTTPARTPTQPTGRTTTSPPVSPGGHGGGSGGTGLGGAGAAGTTPGGANHARLRRGIHRGGGRGRHGSPLAPILAAIPD